MTSLIVPAAEFPGGATTCSEGLTRFRKISPSGKSPVMQSRSSTGQSWPASIADGMQSGCAWYTLAESAPGISAEMNRHERRGAAKRSGGPTAPTTSSKAERTAELYARGQVHLADGRHSEALDCYLQVLKLT